MRGQYRRVGEVGFAGFHLEKSFVMAGLVPAIYVDPRDKPGDDIRRNHASFT
jgi:hypothetical protein